MKTDPKIRPRGPGDPNKQGKPKNDRFFKKGIDKPNHSVGHRGGGGPPGKQWKPRGNNQHKDNRSGGPHEKQWRSKEPKQWKPKGAALNGDNRGVNGSISNRRPGKPWSGDGGKQGGGKPFKHNHQKSQGQRQRGGGSGNKPHGGAGSNKLSQTSSQNLDTLFSTKPEKLNYCLAPERLEAQERAMKKFDKQDREAEQKQKQNEKQRKHKMMTAKTKKGQPVMQGRMELLYEKVQKMVGQG